MICWLSDIFTVWAAWPEHLVDDHEQLVGFGEFIRHHPMIFVLPALTLVVLYVLIAQERRAIRRLLYRRPGQAEKGGR